MFVEKMESELQCGNAKRYSFVLEERGNSFMRAVDYRRFLGVCEGVIHKEK